MTTKPKLKEPMQPDPPKPDSPVPGPIEPRKKKPSERMHALAKRPQSLISGKEDPIEILMRAAGDPTVDAAKAHALYEIVKLIKNDRAEEAYWRDLHRMLPNLPKIAKDGMIEIEAKLGKRGQKTPYVTLDSIVEALVPVLAEYGFAFQWKGDVIPAAEGNPLSLMTATMTHIEPGIGKHSEIARRQVLPEPSGSKNPEQARGSGETYTKRYLLRQLVPFVSHLKEDRDDDAAATSEKERPHEVISKEQVKKLRKEIKDCGVDETVFAEHFGPPENLPVSALNEAIDRCRQFKANRGGDRAATQG
jgi:hypothetical protein